MFQFAKTRPKFGQILFESVCSRRQINHLADCRKCIEEIGSMHLEHETLDAILEERGSRQSRRWWQTAFTACNPQSGYCVEDRIRYGKQDRGEPYATDQHGSRYHAADAWLQRSNQRLIAIDRNHHHRDDGHIDRHRLYQWHQLAHHIAKHRYAKGPIIGHCTHCGRGGSGRK